MPSMSSTGADSNHFGSPISVSLPLLFAIVFLWRLEIPQIHFVVAHFGDRTWNIYPLVTVVVNASQQFSVLFINLF